MCFWKKDEANSQFEWRLEVDNNPALLGAMSSSGYIYIRRSFSNESRV